MTREELKQAYPEITLLDAAARADLEAYLKRRSLIAGNETVIVASKPGEGNMNFVRRIRTDRRSFIVKQSRPWVEKYPKIEAPWDRVIREARFYTLVKTIPDVAESMPVFLDLDPISRVMACEDLGESSDFTDLYGESLLTVEEVDALARWLSALHRQRFNDTERASLTNRDMRELNHEHIFHFPLLDNNGLDLDAITPGLAEQADELKKDSSYVTAVTELGQIYLTDGPTLLHGDYFPGSWLRTDFGVRVIDPEFSFFGFAEFDAGVWLAHLYLTGQSPEIVSRFEQSYEPPAHFSTALMKQFAGVEIMRRLIGVAQLPLTCGLERKAALLEKSRKLVLEAELIAL